MQRIFFLGAAALLSACAPEQAPLPATPTPFQAPLQPSAGAWNQVPSPTPGDLSLTQQPDRTPTLTARVKPDADLELPPDDPESGDAWESPVDGMALLFVPPGKFLMGTDQNFAFPEDDEMPQRRVELDGFWIDQLEVDNQRYAACVEAGGCSPPASFGSKDREDYYLDDAYAEYPVINISWDQAHQYCQWAGRRLPTEAEWEKAARGATGQVYPWGWIGSAVGSQGVRANYCDVNCSYEYKDEAVDDGYDETAPSASFTTGASPYGALNMAGNVWEWVEDWYEAGYYMTAPSENPTGPRTGTLKVIRGGSWMDQAWLGTVFGLRAANRAAHSPESGEYYIGFRCALSASSSKP